MATLERGIKPRSIQEKKGGINKKFAALALTGAVALGGIGIFASQQGEQTKPEPTPITGGIGNPNESNNPTKTSSPTETEKNQEISAEQLTVNSWLDMLSGKQELEENNKYLNFEIKNQEFWQNFIENMNNNGDQPDPLNVSWTGGYISPSPIADGKFSGHKMSGEIEFSNVFVSIDEQEITSADKANGYTFKGLAEISYAERFSNNFIEPENQNDVGNKDDVLAWIHQAETLDSHFSDWKDGSIKFPVAMVNGEWVADTQSLMREATGRPKDSYNGFLIPFESYYSIGCGEEQPTCKIIYKDLPYN